MAWPRWLAWPSCDRLDHSLAAGWGRSFRCRRVLSRIRIVGRPLLVARRLEGLFIRYDAGHATLFIARHVSTQAFVYCIGYLSVDGTVFTVSTQSINFAITPVLGV